VTVTTKLHIFFENDAFTLGPRDAGRISASFFGQNFYNRHKNEIRKLTFENCFSNNRIKTCREFADAGLPLTPMIWFKLCGAVSFWKTKFDCEKNPVKIENFFAGVKKGSKKFRLVCESVAEKKLTYWTQPMCELSSNWLVSNAARHPANFGLERGIKTFCQMNFAISCSIAGIIPCH
jgi:hypothetical protein